MAWFFFDFSDGAYATRDEDGHECASIDAARLEVMTALPEILISNFQYCDFREISCTVRDGIGSVVCEASVVLRSNVS